MADLRRPQLRVQFWLDALVLALAAWLVVGLGLRDLRGAALLLACAVPGLLAARWWQQEPEPDPEGALRALLAGAVTSLGLVPSLAFALHLTAKHPVNAALLTCAALLLAAPLLAVLLRRRRAMPAAARGPLLSSLLPIELARVALSLRGPTLFAIAGVIVLYLARHDGSLPGMTCIGESAWIAAGRNPHGIDLLRENVGDARLGNVGVLGGVLAIFEGAGVPMLFAALGGLMAAGGWLIGCHVGQRAGWGWVGLVLLPLNPWVGSIPLIDENLLALGFCAALLALVLDRQPRWLLVGTLAGLVVSMRHPLAVALPGLLGPVWAAVHRRGAVAAVGVGLALGTAVEIAHHTLAFGAPWRLETAAQYPPVAYRLFGVELQLGALMNWPVHDALVRTPHNPYPMLVGWGLHAADHLGLFVSAALLLGAVVVWRQGSRHPALWAWWCLPVSAGLLVQEGWDHANKMGVLAIVAPALVAWTVAGGRWLVARPRRAAPLALALVAAGWLGSAALRGWQVPPDARYFQVHHLEPVESASHLALGRDRATRLGVWPDVARFNRYGPMWALADKWRALRDHTASPGAGWFEHTVPPPGAPVTVELDLRSAPWTRTDLLRPTDREPDIDLTRSEGLVVLGGMRVPWESQPLTVALTRGPRLSLVEVGMRDFRVREPGCDPARQTCHCAFFDTLERGAGRRACQRMTERVHPAPTLRIRVPAGGVTVSVNVNDVAHVAFLWRATVRPDRADVVGPFELWHN